MIASDDVRRVTFDRAMRGYRCEDVDDYLKQVADSIDSLAAENDDLQKKLVILAQRIDQYRADEDTLSTTMINAQRLGENVIKEAKQKAAEIIRAANIKAEDREQRARDEVELAQQELVTIKQEADAFKKRLMDLYRQHIEMIAKIPEYHTNRAEQQAAQPQPEPQEAPQQPAPQPVEQPAPSRGLGDVYKRQSQSRRMSRLRSPQPRRKATRHMRNRNITRLSRKNPPSPKSRNRLRHLPLSSRWTRKRSIR